MLITAISSFHGCSLDKTPIGVSKVVSLRNFIFCILIGTGPHLLLERKVIDGDRSPDRSFIFSYSPIVDEEYCVKTCLLRIVTYRDFSGDTLVGLWFELSMYP